HIQNTNSQYNLPVFGQKLAYAGNRAELAVAERFADPSVRKSVAADLALIDHLDDSIADRELYLTRTAKVDDIHTYERLKTVLGAAVDHLLRKEQPVDAALFWNNGRNTGPDGDADRRTEATTDERALGSCKRWDNDPVRLPCASRSGPHRLDGRAVR